MSVAPGFGCCFAKPPYQKSAPLAVVKSPQNQIIPLASAILQEAQFIENTYMNVDRP
jgi:hypothetical protein